MDWCWRHGHPRVWELHLFRSYKAGRISPCCSHFLHVSCDFSFFCSTFFERKAHAQNYWRNTLFLSGSHDNYSEFICVSILCLDALQPSDFYYYHHLEVKYWIILLLQTLDFFKYFKNIKHIMVSTITARAL